ncbi:hypothetical protein DSL64_13970 [Dyadobacter luteus]|jgi:hypothetical protein|uniref:Nitrogen fixation protein FixH n=1 Tax=Dyadobacter luteus TaxID=2259619 RepID=A0A3D8YAB9_9BACT|nr:FixH family protein [Dyadobacter luteus]REA60644.1 hypothetical protein DSL64_13970 [Dyadobacter luteus]
MKFNWGTGIAVLYLGFVAMILVLVSMSTNQKIDLVTSQYYEEETKFQEKINKTNRANALEKPLVWELKEEGLSITYPDNTIDQQLSGTIKLYCPANEKNDRSFDVIASGHQQLIPASKIPVGRYRLQIDWKNGTETYWNEDVIVMNP